MSEVKQRNGIVTAVRLEDRLRYLTEVAALAKGMTLTEYIAWALEKSFKDVTLRVRPEPEPEYGTGPDDLTIPDPPDEDEERLQDAAKSVAQCSNALWSESEFKRLEALKVLAPHLLTPKQAELFSSVHAQERYRKKKSNGYVINRELVDAEWSNIVARSEKKGKK